MAGYGVAIKNSFLNLVPPRGTDWRFKSPPHPMNQLKGDQIFSLTLMTISIIALCYIPSFLLWDKSEIKAEELDTYEGTVVDIGLTKVRIGKGNSTSNMVYINLEGLPYPLGLNHLGTESQNYLVNRIKKGDKIKAIFDSEGKRVDEGLNLHVFQLEHKGEILIGMEDTERRNNTFAKIMFGIGTVFMLGPVLLYRYLLKKNKRLAKT